MKHILCENNFLLNCQHIYQYIITITGKLQKITAWHDETAHGEQTTLFSSEQPELIAQIYSDIAAFLNSDDKVLKIADIVERYQKKE